MQALFTASTTPRDTGVDSPNSQALSVITTAAPGSSVSHSSKRDRITLTQVLQAQIQNLEARLEAQLMEAKLREDGLKQFVENLQKAAELKEAQHRETMAKVEDERAGLSRQISSLIQFVTYSIKRN